LTYPMRHRRDFLRLFALTGASSALNIPLIGRRVLAAAPLFEEIPPDVSGIKWVHENAISPNRYLPETMGPGVAFFDFDNDGWMDIFMVNSGASDFYTPQSPLRTRSTRTTATARSVTSRTRQPSPYPDGRPAACGSITTTTAGWTDRLGRDQMASASGRAERFTDLPLDRYVTIVEGKGLIA
jgi:hypothetical protein